MKVYQNTAKSTTKTSAEMPPRGDGGRALSGAGSLDTLAQLGTSPDFNNLRLENLTKSDDLANLQKRARSKYFSTAVSLALVDLDSPLKKAYWNTFHCCNKIEVTGDKAAANYCKNRWCLVCSRIKTADQINRYRATLDTWPDRHFVTLTIPNVPALWLPQALKVMNQKFKTIQEMMKKQEQRDQGERLIAIRKLEVTYNPQTDEYHPHFHIITKTGSMGQKLLSEWLKRFETSSALGQDIRKATMGDLVELFKYFTKILTKIDGKYTLNPEPLDVIFQAIRGKRTFQPVGFQLPKDEEPEEIDADDELTAAADQAIVYEWQQQFNDWISADGVCLSEYEPTEKLSDLVASIAQDVPF